MGRTYSVPWLVWGDFNAICKESHRFNGSRVTCYEVEDCLKWIEGEGMIELKSIGREISFTSTNMNGKTLSRIDHAFRNVEWMWDYGGRSVHYMDPGMSDHSPLRIEVANCG